MDIDHLWQCHGCNGIKCGAWWARGIAWCDACGNQPPPHVTAIKPKGRDMSYAAAARSPARKGNGDKAPNAPRKGGGSDRPPPDNEECQIVIDGFVVVPKTRKETRQAKRVANKMAELQEQNQQFKARLQSVAHEAEADAPANGEQSARLGRDVTQARECVKGLKGVPDNVKALWEGYDAAMQAAQEKLDAALAAKRAANPVKQQFANAQAYQARTKRKWDEQLARVDELQQQLVGVQQKLAEQRTATVEAEKNHTQAAEQTAALGALYASEVAETAAATRDSLHGCQRFMELDDDSAKGAPLDAQEASLLRDLLKLVPEERLHEACSSHGIEASDVVARTLALMSKIEAKEKPSEPATVTALGAHRPPGTAAAAAALTADADALRLAKAEEESAALKAQMRNMLEMAAEEKDSAKRQKMEAAIARMKLPGTVGC